MNIYSVYTDSSKKDNELILIKQGFSFIAGFLNFFWAIYYRMWFIVSVLVVINFFLSNISTPYIAYSINVVIMFIFGFFASEMREYYALKNGYTLSDIILASNEEEAEVKFFERTQNLKRL